MPVTYIVSAALYGLFWLAIQLQIWCLTKLRDISIAQGGGVASMVYALAKSSISKICAEPMGVVSPTRLCLLRLTAIGKRVLMQHDPELTKARDRLEQQLTQLGLNATDYDLESILAAICLYSLQTDEDRMIHIETLLRALPSEAVLQEFADKIDKELGHGPHVGVV